MRFSLSLSLSLTHTHSHMLASRLRMNAHKRIYHQRRRDESQHAVSMHVVCTTFAMGDDVHMTVGKVVLKYGDSHHPITHN